MSVAARRAKIVATLGPATSTDERIEALIRAGVDVVRLNFSHGTQQDHGEQIGRVRAISERCGRPIAIMQDLQGPKIRTGWLKDGQPVILRPGAEITITTEDLPGEADRLSTTYAALPSDVSPGDPILMDDGRIRLRVLATTSSEVRARVEDGGTLGEHKGINLPGVAVSAPALTEKDRADLEFGLEHGVDYVALSFVRSAEDVRGARRLIKSLGASIPLIVKLEKPEAIKDLDAILAVTEGVMVARGDLGVEMPPEKVPIIQKTIIRKANRLLKLVITATQMLESMISEPTPTRAEATDVANAIWDGTDAVMLSGESAIGKYPIEAVRMMDRIVTEAERNPARPELRRGRRSHAEAIARAASSLADDLKVEAIVCFTRSGRTAQLVSQSRPGVPIIALTADPAVERRLAFWWGVTPIRCTLPDVETRLLRAIEQVLIERGLSSSGSTVLIVGALPLRTSGRTNFLKLHRLA